MVEIVSTSNGYPLLSDPGVGVARENRFQLTGPGFVSVSILGMDISVNGLGKIIATDEFAIKTGLQPTPLEICGVKLAKDDRVYHLSSVSLYDGQTRLTLMKDL